MTKQAILTISQFFGIVIQMFWREHDRRIFMRCMGNAKH